MMCNIQLSKTSAEWKKQIISFFKERQNDFKIRDISGGSSFSDR